MPYVIRQLVSNYITEATGRILYLVLAFSKPPNLFAWTRKSFFLRHVLPRIVERRHAAGENRLPRPPESNGAGPWSSIDGTLIASRAGGRLPQICSAATGSPNWIGIARGEGDGARRTEKERIIREENGFSPLLRKCLELDLLFTTNTLNIKKNYFES